MSIRSFLFRASSMERQLQRQLLVLLSLVLLAVLIIVHLTVQQLTVKFVASRLQHDADSLIAALEQGDTDRKSVV